MINYYLNIFAYVSRLVDKQLGAVDKPDCTMDSTCTNVKQATIDEDQNLQDRQSASVEMTKECYVGGDYVSAKLEVCIMWE